MISPPLVYILSPSVKRIYPLAKVSSSDRSSTLAANTTFPPWVVIVVAEVLTIWVWAKTLKALEVVLTTFALKVTFLASMLTAPDASFDCKVEASKLTALFDFVVITPLLKVQVDPSASPPVETIVRSPVPLATLYKAYLLLLVNAGEKD